MGVRLSLGVRGRPRAALQVEAVLIRVFRTEPNGHAVLP